jgi:hypothetical protein
MGVYSDSACTWADVMCVSLNTFMMNRENEKESKRREKGKGKRERERERETEGDIPWQKHPSRSPEAAPGTVAALLISFLDGWLEVDEEVRPLRSSSSLRTAALRGGGSGVAALAFPFPFPFSDFVGWGDAGGGMRSERREPRVAHAVPRRGGIGS